MARYTYTIPRNTKGEGRILMIFTKKSFLWTVACAFVGLIVGYLPIGVIFQHNICINWLWNSYIKSSKFIKF